MTYYRPDTLAEALTLCARPDMRLIAGGTDIYPAQQGRDLIGDILDLTAIDALCGITRGADGWRIGATTSWAELLDAIDEGRPPHHSGDDNLWTVALLEGAYRSAADNRAVEICIDRM